MIVASFYTDDFYEAYGKKLVASCDLLGIEHHVRRVEDRGDWVENVSQKPDYIRLLMSEFDTDVLWVDVDAQVLAPLDLLLPTAISHEPVPFDFAIYSEPGARKKRFLGRGACEAPAGMDPVLWFKTGTVFVTNTAGGHAFLDRWGDLARGDRRAYQQLVCMQAWQDTRPKTLWLPPEYCHMAQFHRRVTSPVITHKFASCERKSVRA